MKRRKGSRRGQTIYSNQCIQGSVAGFTHFRVNDHSGCFVKILRTFHWVELFLYLSSYNRRACQKKLQTQPAHLVNWKKLISTSSIRVEQCSVWMLYGQQLHYLNWYTIRGGTWTVDLISLTPLLCIKWRFNTTRWFARSTYCMSYICSQTGTITVTERCRGSVTLQELFSHIHHLIWSSEGHSEAGNSVGYQVAGLTA